MHERQAVRRLHLDVLPLMHARRDGHLHLDLQGIAMCCTRSPGRQGRPRLARHERLRRFAPRRRRLTRSSIGPDAPRVAQGRLLRRREGAKVSHRTILDDPRLVIARATLVHGFEACLIPRRRNQLEPLGCRGRPGLARRERLWRVAPHRRRLTRRSIRPNAPRIAQGRLLRRREGAEVSHRTILLDLRVKLAIKTLVHAPKARLTARRRHELEPLGRRGRPGLIRRERLWRFAPRRLTRRSIRANVPRIAQGSFLRRLEDTEVALLAFLPDMACVLAKMLVHAPEARLTGRRRHQLEPLGRRGRPRLGRPVALRRCGGRDAGAGGGGGGGGGRRRRRRHRSVQDETKEGAARRPTGFPSVSYEIALFSENLQWSRRIISLRISPTCVTGTRPSNT